MALSSVINPETITGTKKSNLLGAQKFISGENSLGSGVLGSAANKIVKFQKAGVQPSPIDINNIIKTISTGITNSYNNQAQTINSSVTNIINKSIGNFSKDYQDRIKKVDEAKPTGVLQKILGLYRDVIGFIQFFGKRKFVEGLRDNLKALQTSFSESFEVAKLIRQVIIKIVKQLSSLPKTSPSGGGGINLDVDVPGGGIKRTAPRGLNRRMGRGGMLALGAGALGLGAAGAAATNALSDSDAIQPGAAAPEIPGNIVNSLSSIIDRFSKAIDRLVKGSSGKKKSESSRGSGRSAGKIEKPKKTPGATPDGAPGSPANETMSPEVDAAGLKSNFSPIAQDIFQSGKIDSTKLSDRAAAGAMLAVGQMESNYSYDKAYSGMGGEDDNMKGFLQLNQKYHKVSGKKQYLDYTIPKFKGEDVNFTGGGKFNPLIFSKYLKNAKTGSDVANAMKVAGFTANDFEPLGSAEKSNRLSEKQVVAIKKIVFGNINLQNTSPANSKSEAAPVQVVPASTQAATQQQQIRTIAQPPPQQQPQVNYLPIGTSGGGQQTQQQSPGGGGGGGISAPPSPQQKGPTQPFLSPSNPNNFLTLYSRMVYNIVDG